MEMEIILNCFLNMLIQRFWLKISSCFWQRTVTEMKSCTGVSITGSRDHWSHQVICDSWWINVTYEGSIGGGPSYGRWRVGAWGLADRAWHSWRLNNGEVSRRQRLWDGYSSPTTISIKDCSWDGVRGWRWSFP